MWFRYCPCDLIVGQLYRVERKAAALSTANSARQAAIGLLKGCRLRQWLDRLRLDQVNELVEPLEPGGQIIAPRCIIGR